VSLRFAEIDVLQLDVKLFYKLGFSGCCDVRHGVCGLSEALFYTMHLAGWRFDFTFRYLTLRKRQQDIQKMDMFDYDSLMW
jgi:hypothetical protein